VKPLDEASVSKDRYIEPGGLKSLAVRPAADGEAERGTVAIVGPALIAAMAQIMFINQVQLCQAYACASEPLYLPSI
jgi:hypothetical protein